jgi:hypothetical protein
VADYGKHSSLQKFKIIYSHKMVCDTGPIRRSKNYYLGEPCFPCEIFSPRKTINATFATVLFVFGYKNIFLTKSTKTIADL